MPWDGFFNTRDLGGLPIRGGGTTRFGAFIRSADLRFVTEAGWHEARRAGVRTVVDLRNADEIRRITSAAGIDRVEVPFDDVDDVEFWQRVNREQLNGTPLYYRRFLELKAERCGAVMRALAGAAPGGVLFHCAIGRDRTGLVASLLLALVDVEPDAIVEDYEMSTTALAALFARLGVADQGPLIGSMLANRGTTARAALLDSLNSLDAEQYLLAAGASRSDLESIRDRLMATAPG